MTLSAVEPWKDFQLIDFINDKKCLLQILAIHLETFFVNIFLLFGVCWTAGNTKCRPAHVGRGAAYYLNSKQEQ